MDEFRDIIIDALVDYRLWFLDQGGNNEELKQDSLKVELIDRAIDYIRNLPIKGD